MSLFYALAGDTADAQCVMAKRKYNHMKTQKNGGDNKNKNQKRMHERRNDAELAVEA